MTTFKGKAITYSAEAFHVDQPTFFDYKSGLGLSNSFAGVVADYQRDNRIATTGALDHPTLVMKADTNLSRLLGGWNHAMVSFDSASVSDDSKKLACWLSTPDATQAAARQKALDRFAADNATTYLTLFYGSSEGDAANRKKAVDQFGATCE